MSDETTAGELEAMRDTIAALWADMDTLRGEVAALRRELTSGPLATVAREEAHRQSAADYWQARYAGGNAPA